MNNLMKLLNLRYGERSSKKNQEIVPKFVEQIIWTTFILVSLINSTSSRKRNGCAVYLGLKNMLFLYKQNYMKSDAKHKY